MPALAVSWITSSGYAVCRYVDAYRAPHGAFPAAPLRCRYVSTYNFSECSIFTCMQGKAIYSPYLQDEDTRPFETGAVLPCRCEEHNSARDGECSHVCSPGSCVEGRDWPLCFFFQFSHLSSPFEKWFRRLELVMAPCLYKYVV